MQADDDIEYVIRSVVERVRGMPENDSPCVCTIDPKSVMGIALHTAETTLYVHEAEFGFVLPADNFRVIATTCLINCVALFVNSPCGTSFCAHISPCSTECSMREAYEIRKDGYMFADMGLRLKEVFNSIERSAMRISLVGGWTLADNFAANEGVHSARPDSVTSFSAVVLDFIKNIFPGVAVDTSNMNQFPGVSWIDRTPFSKLERVVRGQAFRIAAMDVLCGEISLQTTDLSDISTEYPPCGTTVPVHIAHEGINRLEEMQMRALYFEGWTNRSPVPQSTMNEVCTLVVRFSNNT